MKYESMTIRKAVQMMDERKLLLPHIQRPFVWKQDRTHNQVKKFFDSVLRGYPFSTFLFWVTRDDIQVRRFVDDYRDGMNVKETYLKSSELRDREKTLVLDGQQRLQTLYMALKGTYNGKELYFNILSGKGVFQDGKDELRYDFEYATRDEARKWNGGGAYWVPLKEIVMSDENAVAIQRKILTRMREEIEVDSEIEEQVLENVSQVKNIFNELPLIYYYPIDSTTGKFTDYNEVLEIFIRTNSGGTILSKSDLMFSLIKLNWGDAEEEFEDLINTLNKNGAFYFDKDFILKTALVVLEKGARYQVEKFKGPEGERNLAAVRDNWQRILKSFKYLADFLAYARITSDDLLPSYNALIPIIYFAYIHNCRPNSARIKHNMQVWLYKTLLNANFSGQADTIIDGCVNVIRNYSSVDYFPHSELEAFIKNRGRTTDVDADIIDGNSYIILNLVYLFNNEIVNFQPQLNGNVPEIDHIFPKSKMLLAPYKYPHRLVNNIGNYMFLESSLNKSKTNALPEEYFPQILRDKPDFFERYLIPKDRQLHKPDHFEEFVDARREMIFDTIKKVLVYQE
ncbi:MAG TPA: DUF262 domain-containing protein [Dehalococcoidia bacterium]|nr:DUF262 domain-containing protein [Dehalococcoidia bacterium]